MCIGNKQRETFDIISKHFQGQFDKANRVLKGTSRELSLLVLKYMLIPVKPILDPDFGMSFLWFLKTLFNMKCHALKV